MIKDCVMDGSGGVSVCVSVGECLCTKPFSLMRSLYRSHLSDEVSLQKPSHG